MNNIIRGENADQLYLNAAKEINYNGCIVSPRNQETKELEYAWLILENPENNIVTLKSRNMDMDYLKGELEWYNSGDLRVDNIAKHSKFWNGLVDQNGTVNSNYGFLSLIEKHAGISQYEWCFDKLKHDKDTRQAVINYNQPRHKYPGNKDFVCTLTQQFNIRDDKLNSFVHMRSNDLIFGFTYDLPWFTGLQKKLSDDLGVELGVYQHLADSLHVYKKHYAMLENICKEELK